MPPRRSTNGKECTRSGDNPATTSRHGGAQPEEHAIEQDDQDVGDIMETDNNKGHGPSSLSSAPVTAGKEPDHERLTGGQVLDPENIRSQQPISTPTSATAVHGLASQGRPSAEYPSGQGPQGNLTSRVISNPPQPPGFLSGVDQLSLGLEAPGSGLEGRRVGQPSSTRDQMVGDLLDQLAGLEDSGAPADQINLVQRRLNRTIWAFGAQESSTPHPSVVERARKMQRDTLIGMRDPPRLNGDRPTAAEVEQWIKDLNMALRTNECGLDTYHRIVWVISLLLGNGLRDLINSAVQSGEITTLAQLLARVTSETLFTRIARQTEDAGYIKFDNAMPFYNCVWRTPDTWAAFNAFMTTQGDSINPHPFRHPDGTWQHLPMIYFVWSKLPVAIQQQMKISGCLRNHPEDYPTFVQLIQNAEEAIRVSNAGLPWANPRNQRGNRAPTNLWQC